MDLNNVSICQPQERPSWVGNGSLRAFVCAALIFYVLICSLCRWLNFLKKNDHAQLLHLHNKRNLFIDFAEALQL